MLPQKAFISANEVRSKNKILEPVQVYTFQLEEGHIKQTMNTQSNSKRAEVCCECKSKEWWETRCHFLKQVMSTVLAEQVSPYCKSGQLYSIGVEKSQPGLSI